MFDSTRVHAIAGLVHGPTFPSCDADAWPGQRPDEGQRGRLRHRFANPSILKTTRPNSTSSGGTCSANCVN